MSPQVAIFHPVKVLRSSWALKVCFWKNYKMNLEIFWCTECDLC